MPADLQEHIKQEEHANRLDTVWVSCSGENPADVENMGAIQYIPRRGFPGYYFPFTNTPGYLSPLVAVFFERPKCKCFESFLDYLRCLAIEILEIARDDTRQRNAGVTKFS